MLGTVQGQLNVDELDSDGAYLGNRGAGSIGQTVSISGSISGARDFAYNIETSAKGGNRYLGLGGGVVSMAWTISGFFSNSYNIRSVTGNADGDLFASFAAPGGPLLYTWTFPWGMEGGNFIVKWDGSGGHVYTKHIPIQTNVSLPGNSGDLFLGGPVEAGVDLGCGPMMGPGSYYVARIDTGGACLWTRTDLGMSLVGKAPDGGVIVSSPSFQGTTDIGCGAVSSGPSAGTLLAKLDAAGLCVWSKIIAAPYISVAVSAAGDIALSKGYTGTVDLGGGPLTSVGTTDLAIGRLDASGNHVWSKTFGNAGASLCGASTFACNAVVDPNGSVVVSSALTGWVDFGGGPLGSMAAQTCAVKLDGSGAFLWQHQWPATTHVEVDPCGAVLGAHDAGAVITVDKLSP